ncbi:MAG: heat-inducible transcriptional repressor HrcA [Actinomycetaceae bacterium]|nr:heat-inducible transcriptional repressor HrcA [Actinomycetaceae bacterium]
MATADRRLDVLRAIVSDYVATREPVGSKALAQRYELGVSPATIRNDMAALEEAGLIYQPHTSAGRIPTVQGYRTFVDRLATLKPMSLPERRAVESFLSDAVDIDDVVERTVRLLAQLTRQVAIVQYPHYDSATLVRVELVDLGPGRTLVVVITDDGQVEQRVIPDYSVEADDLRSLRDQINEVCVGTDLQALPNLLSPLSIIGNEQERQFRTAVCQAVTDLTRRGEEERILVAGTANLARSGVDFTRSIVPVLDALEEQVALLRLFSAASTDDVTVSIGEENLHDGLVETAVVSGTYSSENSNAHLAVVGPVRMDYVNAMSAVHAVGAYLTHFLHGRGQ